MNSIAEIYIRRSQCNPHGKDDSEVNHALENVRKKLYLKDTDQIDAMTAFAGALPEELLTIFKQPVHRSRLLGAGEDSRRQRVVQLDS